MPGLDVFTWQIHLEPPDWPGVLPEDLDDDDDWPAREGFFPPGIRRPVLGTGNLKRDEQF